MKLFEEADMYLNFKQDQFKFPLKCADIILIAMHPSSYVYKLSLYVKYMTSSDIAQINVTYDSKMLKIMRRKVMTTMI